MALSSHALGGQTPDLLSAAEINREPAWCDHRSLSGRKCVFVWRSGALSLGLVRQRRDFSAAYRKLARHVQRNLLAQAKGEEMVEEAGGHGLKMWVILKLENNSIGLWSRGGEGVGFTGQQGDYSRD